MNSKLLRFIKVLLVPFIPVYALIMALRNLFFDIRLFKARKADAYVISVGNITMGGSGKTPLVIYLLNFLKDKNFHAGVLSRGYGRRTKGYLLVSEGNKILTEVNECGDEMYHTVLECSVPAAVSEDRVKGSEQLIKKTGIEVLVLDDAFQHRWIGRDLNLLIFEQRFLIQPYSINKFLLPSGILREPFRGIRRADAVVINRKFSGKAEIPAEYMDYLEDKPVFTAFYKAIEFVDIVRRTKYRLDEFSGQKSLVVSGIANPFSFINILNQTKVDTGNRMVFRDHKDYTIDEIQKIRKMFYATNSHSVITTEKDAVKLLNFSHEFDDIDIFYLKIEISFDKEKEFENFILERLRQNKIKV
jgi:tetraacyldisaccharide 4'-kinase